jgi:ribosomal protein S18 acetylase RimI-like enzyme
MLRVARIADRAAIAAFLCRDPQLHVYAIGDLDDFFWPYTTWYAMLDDDAIVEIALLYRGMATPTLLALTHGSLDRLRLLLESILDRLPPRFYAHLSGDLINAFDGRFRIDSYGLHWKMALLHPARLNEVDDSQAIMLGAADQAEIEALYEQSYPGNWFDPRMLETGCFAGVRRDGRLVSVAGVHVYSPRYRVAALGNIATHPAYRGHGFAAAATARLCQRLFDSVEYIGLNVTASNTRAINLYRRLGFEQIGSYEECPIERL